MDQSDAYRVHVCELCGAGALLAHGACAACVTWHADVAHCAPLQG
jgi:hypothetical protein